MIKILSLVAVISLSFSVVQIHSLDNKIVGGFPITIESAPYQVSLQLWNIHICGGSIISEKWVLTASHCTVERRASDFSIRAGSSIYRSGGDVIAVKNIIQHPQYDKYTMDYDFSLLELESRISLDEKKQIIPLASENERISPYTLCKVSGWGVTKVRFMISN